ncbi:MAG TPA: VOC family protein [Steroidobacteraceae bacterium]|nr:VOC family protein [Steroidobacteraceae bacterium]
MTGAEAQGKFLWHELVTANPGAAVAFYAKVLGWRAQPMEKDPSYTVWIAAKGPAGGMMQLSAAARASGASSHWLAYVGTGDIDATVAVAQRLGGRVATAVTPLPDGGRYAVLTDPQGGEFGVYTPAATGGGQPRAEEFSWHELATADHAQAFHFYRELFGWEQMGVHDMGAMGSYLLFGKHGRQLGGMLNRPATMAASWPHWLSYASVPSAAKAAEATTAAGGRVANPPHEVPGGTWIAQLLDPEGAAIAVHQGLHAAAAAPAARPPKPAKPPAAASPSAPATQAAAPARPAPAKPAAAPPPAAAAPKPSAPKPSAPKPTAPKPSPAAAGAPKKKTKTKAKSKATVKTKTKAKAKAKVKTRSKTAARRTRKVARKKAKSARSARKSAPRRNSGGKRKKSAGMRSRRKGARRRRR